MLHAIFRRLPQSLGERSVERDADLHVKPASDERHAERRAGLRGQFHADAARDAFAGFENDPSRLADKLELAAMLAQAGFRIDLVLFGQDAKPAVASRTAVAMAASPRGFLGFGDQFPHAQHGDRALGELLVLLDGQLWNRRGEILAAHAVCAAFQKTLDALREHSSVAH